MLRACQLLAVLLGVASLGQGLPRGYKSLHMSMSVPQKAEEISDTQQTTELGQLVSLHAVGIATHPSDESKLVYADETALYSFDKTTGSSSLLAGGETFGLLTSRVSVDGSGTEAKFKYITKIVSRPSGVYVFDYDQLRKYEPEDNSVKTIAALRDSDWMEAQPYTGVINSAENLVYFSSVEGYGHFVMKMEIPDGKVENAELVTAGPSLISSLELTPDEKHILLADVDAKALVEVNLSDGEQKFLAEGSDDSYPVADITMLNDRELLMVNSGTNSLLKYDITESPSTAVPLCDEACMSEIVNPIDVAVDMEKQVLYVLDGISHPTLPTYVFTIKKVLPQDMMSTTTSAVSGKGTHTNNLKGYPEIQKLFSSWLSSSKLYTNSQQL